MRSPGSWLTVGLAFVVTTVAACGDQAVGPGAPVKVVTWNLYLGADLTPLATVPTPAAVPAVAATMWAKVQATDFPARAKVLAARIAGLAPDLVALQEVTLYRRQSPSDYAPGDGPNAIDVELDFLALLLAELNALGSPYGVAIEAPNADVELPVSDGAGGLFDLRVTDRDVILAARDVVTTEAAQQTFEERFHFAVGGVGGVPLSFTRSASHVKVGLPTGGPPFVFATSHLEIEGLAATQLKQATELVGFMNALPGPLLLAGDFNSAPGLSSYPLLTKSFRDLAAALPPPATDPTCCQAEDLKNATSTASERIDLVLTRGSFTLNALEPVGTAPATDRTPSGLWASDHFGVSAALEVR